ncbi:hypothetical protein SSS_02658 [Sarcoptes scabiei]|uniref:Uncharacterized protein n=1 Tax=Sarcoptes scabiei TaxID=52283 RepID=A0A834VET5_SARSC|nr:hypothetical protein SSS_02658 [Sarcoptes scabiei]
MKIYFQTLISMMMIFHQTIGLLNTEYGTNQIADRNSNIFPMFDVNYNGIPNDNNHYDNPIVNEMNAMRSYEISSRDLSTEFNTNANLNTLSERYGGDNFDNYHHHQQQQPEQFITYRSEMNFKPKPNPYRLLNAPTTAAVRSRYYFETRPDYEADDDQFRPEPQIIEITGYDQPIEIHFKSATSRIYVKQTHESLPSDSRTEYEHREEEPKRLVSNIRKPIIQEVHEIISPYRKVLQEIRPVMEEIHTIVSQTEPIRSNHSHSKLKKESNQKNYHRISSQKIFRKLNEIVKKSQQNRSQNRRNEDHRPYRDGYGGITSNESNESSNFRSYPISIANNIR